jgi:predicted PurR-regulated permease PerM
MIIKEKHFKTIAIMVVIGILLILSFLILRPILISSIFGLIFAFIFHPVYKKLYSFFKNKNLSAFIICLGVVIIIILPLWFLIPIMVKQVFEIYIYLQQTGFSEIIESMLPSFSSQDFSKNIIIAINSFIGEIASSFLNRFTDVLLNSPVILLNISLIIFVFFFGLRDGEDLIDYLQKISPLSKESEKKIFKQFKDITHSVIFGQFIVGLIQGIITGIGFFIFGVPNAIVLTLIASLVGILPIIGPWLVWVPVDIWLFLNGRFYAGIGMLIYGILIISWVDNLIRPLIVSKKTKINPGIILVSMVGGLLTFGVLGLILGPLIISYLLLLLEFYKNKKANLVEPATQDKRRLFFQQEK